VLAPMGKKRTDYTREEFVAKVQEWKDEYEERIKGQLSAMGCSCDWDRWRFTMDDVCARAVRESFFRLFKAGLIYRGKRLVNWDPVTQTALADDEVEMHEVQGKFYYLRYPLVHETAPGNHSPVTWGELVPRGYPGASKHIEDEQAWVTVATTRPETYLGDTAVAVNPKDPRAVPLRGFKAELPLVGRVIPIVEDDYVVLPDPESSDPKAKYATGFLKVTPAHDPNDWELGQRHGLAAINVMAPDASISDKHGWEDVGNARIFIGKSREDARKLVIEEFRARSVAEGAGDTLVEDIKDYTHSVGHSYRSHAMIEPYLSDQWYVRVTDDRLVGVAQRAVVPEQRSTKSYAPEPGVTGDGAMRIFPDRYAKMYEAWHDNLRDWCISRQLWWGHRIPVWRPTERLVETKSSEELAALATRIFSWQSEGRLATQYRGEFVRAEKVELEDDALTSFFVCVRDPAGADADIVNWLEREHFAQDEDVLDTWYSSALWPLSTMGWPEPGPERPGLLGAFNPTNVLSTAREILTLWVSRMVMFNRFFTNVESESPDRRGRLPFHHVYIHAVVQDGEGKRMSKSAGNGVDPLDIIHSHGADALRFTLCQMTTETQDVRMPVEEDPETGRNTSPKFDLGKRFCNKTWNASRFTLMMLDEAEGDDGAGLASIDRWMLSRLCASVQQIDNALANYRFSEVAGALYDLLWRDFCDWYLEGVKPTVKHNAAQRAVLKNTLDAIIRLLHPVSPFVTEAIYEAIRERDTGSVDGLTLTPSDDDSGLLCRAGWPQIDASLRDEALEQSFERARALIGIIRDVRATQKIPPRDRVALHVASADMALIKQWGSVIETIAGLSGVSTEAPPAGAVEFVFEGHPLHIAGLAENLDAGAEKERLTKRVEELTQSVSVLDKRLSNPGYTEKAPAHLVQQTRDERQKLDGELQAAKAALAELG
jgi:valyl-tRNA synthetase